jgi:hypothetical protein
MIPKRSIGRGYVACLLLLSGVLVLGIVQWSFLPLLIQNGPTSGTPVLEFSTGHTSKFAAPFKALFGDGSNPYLVPSRITLRREGRRIVRLPEAPISSPDDFSLTHRPVRAPPAA